MIVVRERGIGTVALALLLSVSLGGTASAQEPVSPKPARPISDVSSGGRTANLQLVPCSSDADCDDRNACTEDACVDEVCQNIGDPACVPCEGGILGALDELRSRGIEVNAHLYGISEAPGGAFSCLTDHVVNALGAEVPGDGDTCVFPGGASPSESWGPATAIVASRFPWTSAEHVHVVVPIGDEGPCNGTRGDGCNDPGDDRDSVDNAVQVALANGVIVSPVVGSGTDDCAFSLAALLAQGTGGSILRTEDAGDDLATSLAELLAATCPPEGKCPPIQAVFVMDTSGSMRDEAIRVCGAASCDDLNACTGNDRCVAGICGGEPNFDQQTFCCDPADGQLTELSDGDPCTDDVCDPQTGVVEHPVVEDGTPCDDGLFCTVDTACESGICAGAVPRDCSDLDGPCRIGVCNEDAGQCEVSAAREGEACDDGVFCTEQTVCEGGECSGGVPRDCSHLDTECLVGECSEAGRICEPRQLEPGTPCDDGDVCTVEDRCSALAQCIGTDIRTLPCTTDEDCFGGTCDPSSGECVCGPTPLLVLRAVPGSLPAGDCFVAGEEVTVLVELGFSTSTIAGGDLRISYDPAALEFADIVPGVGIDPASPFALELFRSVDEQEGIIAYSVGIMIGEPGTTGPAVMAGIRFNALEACSETELCFLQEKQNNTILADVGGDSVPFEPRCTGPLFTAGPSPEISCPDSVKTNADAGTTRATVTWEPPTASGGCDGSVAIECTAENSFGVNIDHLIQAGGLFPAGLSEFECRATDECGVTATCRWTVEVNRVNTFAVDVELSPRMTDRKSFQPLQRCVEFEFYLNCVQAPNVVRRTLDFGLPFDFPGQATEVSFDIPAGRYVCVTARDPQHTLRSAATPQIAGDRYTARFIGDPFFDGNWLVNGNLNGDSVIDIVDFGLFLNQYLSTRDPHTPCDDVGLNADINGDGMVDQLDMTFISLNFRATDKGSCCPGGTATASSPALSEISVAELRARHLHHLVRYDVDGDGVLTLEDIARVLQAGPRSKTLLHERGQLRPGGAKHPE